MSRVFVTGATGLIGSVIAQQLREAGHDVVALVRTGTDAGALEALGVTIVRGDLTEPSALARSMAGADTAIHSAAIVGGPQQDLESSRAVNVTGTVAVMDAARSVGLARLVLISSAAVFDRSLPLTEASPLDPDPAPDPYTLTKLEAHRQALQRLDAGQDIVFVLPGATFGPSPMGERMINVAGGNQRIVRALRGEPARYPPMRAPWSHTGDVARVTLSALARGHVGRCYLALGGPDSVMTIGAFVNRACELAGVTQRVDDVPLDRLDDPEMAARFGPTLIEMAKKPLVEPFFDATITEQELGIRSLSLDDAILDTIRWARSSQFV